MRWMCPDLFRYGMMRRQFSKLDMQEILVYSRVEIRFLIDHPAEAQLYRIGRYFKTAAGIEQVIGNILGRIVNNIADDLQIAFFAKHEGKTAAVKAKEQFVALLSGPVDQQGILMPLGGNGNPFFKNPAYGIGYPVRIVQVVPVQKIVKDAPLYEVAENKFEHILALLPVV